MRHACVRSLQCFLLMLMMFATINAIAQETSASDPKHLRFLTQHLQFLSVDGFNQFRYVDNRPGDVAARDDYYKLSTVGRLTLVGEGVTYLQFRAESGRSFYSSYDYTGIGMHEKYWSFNLKSLFLGQKFGHHLEAQAGGLEYDRGAGTEATYADNDGWLEGYRLTYAVQKHFTPDALSVTVGYSGDFKQPNVFARLPRMAQENYVQILARKRVGTNADVSAEFDSLQAIRYTREAVHLQKLRLLVVDEIVLESITRTSDTVRSGGAGTVFRTCDRKGRLRLGMFFTDIPEDMFLKDGKTIFYNGDFYVLGQRLGPNIRIVPLKNLDIGLMGSARTDNTASTRYRGQISVCYHFASLLNRALR